MVEDRRKWRKGKIFRDGVGLRWRHRSRHQTFSVIFNSRFVKDDAGSHDKHKEAGKAKDPENHMSYRVTDIEGAIEAAEGPAGTIQQLGFVQRARSQLISLMKNETSSERLSVKHQGIVWPRCWKATWA